MNVMKKYLYNPSLTRLTFCLLFWFTALSAFPAKASAANTYTTFTDESTGLVIALTQTDSEAFASISDGSSFIGGDLPDTITYEDTVYPITAIGAQAFMNYTGDITALPSGTANIQLSAFNGCAKLDIPALPENITYIPYQAFKNCVSLKLDRLPGNLTGIDMEAFSGCVSLELTELPDSVKKIKGSAFSGCTSLALVRLPDALETIGNAAFYNCSSLRISKLPETLTSLGESAFTNCTGITISRLPDGLSEVNSYVFRNCTSLTSMTIPEGVSTLSFEAFRNCSSLVSVSLPDSLTEIDSQVFMDCPKLELSALPANVTSVGHQAFYGCDSITYMALGDNITEFAVQCFENQPDIIAASGSKTLETLQAAKAERPGIGNLILPWDGTQNQLDTDKAIYISGSQTVAGDLTLSGGKSLIITGNGTLTVSGTLTIESEAEICIDAGGTLIAAGTIVNNGTIINKGSLINQSSLVNNNIIQSFTGEITGNEIEGNAALTSTIAITSYTGNYDTKPHAGITAITGLKEGDIVSYSTNYSMYHLDQPERVTWSDTCPEYTTVSDASSPVTVKVERMENNELKTAAILTASVVIQKVKLEITEIPKASAITEGDALEKSTFSGGKAVIEGTDIEITSGGFYWSNFVKSTVPTLEDSKATQYDLYYIASSQTGYSTDLAYAAATVEVIECFHEGTERILENEQSSTCTRTGWSGDLYCGQCRDLLAAGSALPLLDHTWDEGTVLQEATAEHEGRLVYTCLACGQEKAITIPKLEAADPGHSGNDPYVPDSGGSNTPGSDDSTAAGDNSGTADGGSSGTTDGGSSGTTDGGSSGTTDGGGSGSPADNGPGLSAAAKMDNPITKISAYKKPIKSKIRLNAAGDTTYKVKNRNIASVNKRGVVTLKNYGITTITVKSAGNEYYKPAVKKLTITVTPKKVSLRSLKSSRPNALSVSWKRNSSVTGYKLQYSLNRKFKGAKSLTVTKNKTVSAALKKLKPGKKYYVRICAYKKVGKKKICGEWSKIKSATVKK